MNKGQSHFAVAKDDDDAKRIAESLGENILIRENEPVDNIQDILDEGKSGLLTKKIPKANPFSKTKPKPIANPWSLYKEI